MFSKNEARPEYNPKVLKEAYGKEDRAYRVYDKFVPNPRMSTLCGKFWSKFDREDLSQADEKLMNLLKDHRDRLPAQKFPEPVLESQEIGWYAKTPLIPLRRRDRRFYTPRVRSISTFITPIKKKSGK